MSGMSPGEVDAESSAQRIAITGVVDQVKDTETAQDEETAEPVGLPSLRDRFFRPETLISFGIALFLIVFFTRRLDLDPGAIWRHVRGANFFLYALAFVVFYGSFGLRAFRWRRMLNRAGISAESGYRMPTRRGLLEIFLLSWFANCVVPAKLGDAYRGYLFKRESGASFSTTLGTIFAERLTDLTVLFAAMVTSALFVFGPSMPGQTGQWLLFGAVLTVAVLIGVALLWVTRTRLEERLPFRIRDKFGRMHNAIFACLRRPWGFFGISFLIWIGEGLRVYLVAAALGADISASTAVFVALMSSLLTTLPITPAGLGVVETAMIVVLVLVGVDESLAGAVALLDRVVGYWSLIVVGLPLYLWRVRRTLA
jgi:uncharacterized protein (TIRG00374 family)